jgi:outer membrane protein TolC
MFSRDRVRRAAVLLMVSALAWGGAGWPAFGASALAEGPAAPGLSLQQALQMAQENSTSIKAAQDEIKSANSKQSDAQQAALGTFNPDVGPNENPATDAVFKALAASNINLAQAQNDLTAAMAKVELDTFTDYYAIAASQAALDKAQADADRDDQNLRVARAMFAVGLNTDADVAAAEAQAENSKKALDAARNALEKAYITFNQEVGLMPGDRPVLTDQLDYSEFSVDSLDAEANKAVASSNTIAKLQQMVSLEQLEVNYPYNMGPTGPIFEESQQTLPDLDAARQNLAGAADQLQVQVRNLYQDIKSLEAQYSGLQAALRAARKNLQTVQLHYSVGLTTQAKVKAAEAAVAELQGNIAALIYNHEVMKANFHWLTGEPVVNQA